MRAATVSQHSRRLARIGLGDFVPGHGESMHGGRGRRTRSRLTPSRHYRRDLPDQRIGGGASSRPRTPASCWWTLLARPSPDQDLFLDGAPRPRPSAKSLMRVEARGPIISVCLPPMPSSPSAPTRGIGAGLVEEARGECGRAGRDESAVPEEEWHPRRPPS